MGGTSAIFCSRFRRGYRKAIFELISAQFNASLKFGFSVFAQRKRVGF